MRTIQGYLTRSLTLAQIFIFAALGITLYLAIRNHLLEELDHSLAIRLEAMSALVEYEEGRIQMEELGSLGRRFSAQLEEPDFFELRDASGAVLVKSESLGRELLPFELPIGIHPVITNYSNADGHLLRIATQRVAIEDRKDLPPVYLSYAVERSETDEFLDWFAIAYFLFSSLAIAALGISSRISLRKGLAPLGQLSRHAAALETSNLTESFPSQNMPQELIHISDTLNSLMNRIQDALDREKQLTQDIAHDLRTPVAELRAIAQSTLNYPSSAEETRRALEESLSISGEMSKLIDTLLALARTDSAQLRPSSESSDLLVAFSDAFHSNQNLLEQRKLRYDLLEQGPLIVRHDPSLLSAIVRNLVDNAAQYAAEGTMITLDYFSVGESFSARLSNSAPELTADDLPQLFQRHWRKDASRHGASHTGLGLALAQAYAQAQGLQLTAELSTQKILTITLFGPLGDAG